MSSQRSLLKCKLIYYYLLFSEAVVKVWATLALLDKGLFPLEQDSVGAQFYIDIENKHKIIDCMVHTVPKMCCLTDETKKFCHDSIYGDTHKNIPPKGRETFIFVYPSLFQYDQVGFCDFDVIFKCGKVHSKRHTIKIPFDTTMSRKKRSHYLVMYRDKKRTKCDSLDQDALNECLPVNCDHKYAGQRSFYDVHDDKCKPAPVCATDMNKELPDVAYEPQSNTCKDLQYPFTITDIYAINSGLGVVTEASNIVKVLKLQAKSNCSTISQNLSLIRDLLKGDVFLIHDINGNVTVDSYTIFRRAILAICLNIMAVCALILSFVCCLHALVCMYKRWVKGELYNPIERCFQKTDKHVISRPKTSHLDREVTDKLLQEVVARDLPMELRESADEMFERVSRELEERQRYRDHQRSRADNQLYYSDYSTSYTSSEND